MNSVKAGWNKIFRIDYFMTAILVFVIMLASALAQQIPTDVNAGELLVKLFTSGSELTKLGIGMILIVLFVKLFNWAVVDRFIEKKSAVWKTLKQVLVYFLGVLYAVLFLVEEGEGWLKALTGYFVGGGAIQLYNVIKPLLKKWLPDS